MYDEQATACCERVRDASEVPLALFCLCFSFYFFFWRDGVFATYNTAEKEEPYRKTLNRVRVILVDDISTCLFFFGLGARALIGLILMPPGILSRRAGRAIFG